MNIGIIIGIILICLGVVTFWGMFFTNIKLFEKLPPATIFLCATAIICGFLVTIFAWAYVPYNPDSVKDKGYEHVCAICGKEAIFAESVINSKSSDWFCQKHWQDVKKHYGY